MGDRTDYDKLIMDITTDGSISPADAVQSATLILMKHFELITGITIGDPVLEPVDTEEEEKVEAPARAEPPVEEPQVEDTDLADTYLSKRYVKILSAGGHKHPERAGCKEFGRAPWASQFRRRVTGRGEGTAEGPRPLSG